MALMRELFMFSHYHVFQTFMNDVIAYSFERQTMLERCCVFIAKEWEGAKLLWKRLPYLHLLAEVNARALVFSPYFFYVKFLFSMQKYRFPSKNAILRYLGLIKFVILPWYIIRLTQFVDSPTISMLDLSCNNIEASQKRFTSNVLRFDSIQSLDNSWTNNVSLSCAKKSQIDGEHFALVISLLHSMDWFNIVCNFFPSVYSTEWISHGIGAHYFLSYWLVSSSYRQQKQRPDCKY